MPDMEQSYIGAASSEDMARILMALAQEVWALRDRMAVTEYLLAERAGILPQDIDDYVPTPDQRAEMERLRNRYVAKVIGAPLAAQERSVEQILARGGFPVPPA